MSIATFARAAQRLVRGGLLGALMYGVSISPRLAAQTPLSTRLSYHGMSSPPKVSAVRLYVLDCGAITVNRPETSGLTREEVDDTNMPVTCYLVVHPKGTLVYDAGLPDKIVGRPLYENMVGNYARVVGKTLWGQLADIGYHPEDITYLALSHSHYDHTGNANYFYRSTWITPEAEYDLMFDPKDPLFNLEEFDRLKDAKKILIKGDYDVFGDGTVVLLQTPGHSAGHQSLYVKLARTGGVVLTGDLYHYTEEKTKNRVPPREHQRGTAETRASLDDFMAKNNAQLWIGHSSSFYRAALKAPAWYE